MRRLQVNVAAVEPSPGRSLVLVVVRDDAVNRRFAALPGSLIGSATVIVNGATVYLYGLIEYVASVEIIVKLGDVVCDRFGP